MVNNTTTRTTSSRQPSESVIGGRKVKGAAEARKLEAWGKARGYKVTRHAGPTSSGRQIPIPQPQPQATTQTPTPSQPTTVQSRTVKQPVTSGGPPQQTPTIWTAARPIRPVSQSIQDVPTTILQEGGRVTQTRRATPGETGLGTVTEAPKPKKLFEKLRRKGEQKSLEAQRGKPTARFAAAGLFAGALTVETIRHPIRAVAGTVQTAASAVTRPRETFGAIGRQAVAQPERLAGEVGGAILLGKAISVAGKGVAKVTSKVSPPKIVGVKQAKAARFTSEKGVTVTQAKTQIKIVRKPLLGKPQVYDVAGEIRAVAKSGATKTVEKASAKLQITTPKGKVVEAGVRQATVLYPKKDLTKGFSVTKTATKLPREKALYTSQLTATEISPLVTEQSGLRTFAFRAASKTTKQKVGPISKLTGMATKDVMTLHQRVRVSKPTSMISKGTISEVAKVSIPGIPTKEFIAERGMFVGQTSFLKKAARAKAQKVRAIPFGERQLKQTAIAKASRPVVPKGRQVTKLKAVQQPVTTPLTTQLAGTAKQVVSGLAEQELMARVPRTIPVTTPKVRVATITQVPKTIKQVHKPRVSVTPSVSIAPTSLTAPKAAAISKARAKPKVAPITFTAPAIAQTPITPQKPAVGLSQVPSSIIEPGTKFAVLTTPAAPVPLSPPISTIPPLIPIVPFVGGGFLFGRPTKGKKRKAKPRKFEYTPDLPSLGGMIIKRGKRPSGSTIQTPFSPRPIILDPLKPTTKAKKKKKKKTTSKKRRKK